MPPLAWSCSRGAPHAGVVVRGQPRKRGVRTARVLLLLLRAAAAASPPPPRVAAVNWAAAALGATATANSAGYWVRPCAARFPAPSCVCVGAVPCERRVR
jgi:hypothetical protein